MVGVFCTVWGREKEKYRKVQREGGRERVVGVFNSVGERERIGWEGMKRRREG